jgi:hypothetical protein
VSGDAMHQPTWPLLLKIEHMVAKKVMIDLKNGPIRKYDTA